MIYIDDNSVMVGGWILPGLLKSIEVDGEILYDELEIEGRSDRPKQVTGYADGKIYIDLILHGQTEDEVIQKLTKIQRIFRKPDVKTPYAYYVVNRHINARDINLIVLKKVTSKEVAGQGYNIVVNLEFFEYNPITITAQKSNASEAAASSSVAQQSTNNTLTEEYQTYLSEDRGKAPKIHSKAAASPAVDDYDKPKKVLKVAKGKLAK